MAWIRGWWSALALMVVIAGCGDDGPPGDGNGSESSESSGGTTDPGSSTSTGDEATTSSTSTPGSNSDASSGDGSSSGSSSGDATTGEAVVRWTPSIFVSRMQGDDAVPTLYIDPWAVDVMGSDFQAAANSLVGGEFFPDGERMVVASRSLEEIHVVHLTGEMPEWTAAGEVGPLGQDLGLDAERGLLWLVRGGEGLDDLVAVDVDEASPTFGEIAASIEDAATLETGEPWTFSSARAELAYTDFETDALVLRDADPQSATFGEVKTTVPIPGVFGWAIAAAYSGDGSELWLGLFDTDRSEIARYDFDAAAFVDHDAMAGGTQNIGTGALELDGLIELDVDAHGTTAIVLAGQAVVAITVDGASIVAETLVGSPGTPRGVCMIETPDDTLLVAVGTDPAELHVWRASDFAAVGEVSIGSGGFPRLVCPAYAEMEVGR